jgi:hypothetical protein
MVDEEHSPKREAEALMNTGLVLAGKMLQEHGEFFPFGVAMKSDGEIEFVGVKDGRERLPSHDVLDLLIGSFLESALLGTYRAVAVFADVCATPPGAAEKTDAIMISLEHVDGYCIDVLEPYRIHDGVAEYGPMWAQKRVPQVFRAESSES